MALGEESCHRFTRSQYRRRCLASVAPPCIPGAGVVLAPVESLDEGGGLTVGALALEIFCAPRLLSQVLLHLPVKQFSYPCLIVTP